MRTVLRRAVAVLVTAHGLVHLLGAATGFGWAGSPVAAGSVTRGEAVAWLLAAPLVVTAGLLLAARAAWWWVATGVAAVVSQAVVVTAWDDAKAGTAVNLLMLAAAGYGYAAQGPRSLRAEYRRRAAAALTGPALGGPPPGDDVVTDADLAALPGPVAGYLRRCGAVGRPRVRSFAATVHGRIRGGPHEPWMAFTGEQVDTYGPAPRRVFRLDATRSGLPVDVLHVVDERGATMRVKVCSVVPVVDAAGLDLDRAETVTLFNDLCVLAPAALVDAPVAWEPVDAHRVRGAYTAGGRTVTAELVFDDDHDLVDFVSADRLRAAPDGRGFTRQRWSTPLRAYRTSGGRRLATAGEGRWHAPPPEGEFPYLDIRVDTITYNPAPPPVPRVRRVGAAVRAGLREPPALTVAAVVCFVSAVGQALAQRYVQAGPVAVTWVLSVAGSAFLTAAIVVAARRHDRSRRG